ncbi:MAG TPA: TerB family tellurite resistance protein, partial [Chryseosolibacter sp.]|nr:TerB family tellurite resistance protein [Chryseosolibacter sp.]
MSEEILKALTRLFAIITKQDGGVTDKERTYVIHFFQTELDHDTIESYLKLYDEYSGYGKEDKTAKGQLTSVKDSVKTLGICKKINQTLTQKQKVVVLTKLLELVGSGIDLSPQRRDIINTVASVFNIAAEEFNIIQKFILAEDPHALNAKDVLIINNLDEVGGCDCKHFHGQIDGSLLFLRLRSVDMYFTKYLGTEATMLNGFIMERGRLYLFTHGS